MDTENTLTKTAAEETAVAERTRCGACYRPNVDIMEQNDELLVVADVPGARSDSIDVKFENGTLEIYLPPVRGREYVVGVDPAGGGVNGDYSAAEVVDMEQGLQCAEFAAHVRPRELARIVVELAQEYNNAWLVVERNNHGCAVLGSVEESCKYEKVYGQKGQAGWLTTSMSKLQAVERLERSTIEQPWIFTSRRLLGEFRSFVRLADGGSGAKAGTHDDRLMALAIALAARADLMQGGARRQ